MDTATQSKEKTAVILEQWQTMRHWVNLYLNKLSDEDLAKEIFPGSNHGIWILGHLIACEDDIAPYIRNKAYLFKEYQKIFSSPAELQKPELYPSALMLREQWKEVCIQSESILSALSDDELDKGYYEIFEKQAGK